MRETGLDESQKMSVILLLSNYVRVQATMEAQIDAAVRAAGISGAAAMAGYGQLLRLLLDEHRFPQVMAVADAGVLDQADPWEDEFTFGLERILDGVDVLVRGVASKD
jgi:Tetracyclin repressor-like, C-terminal domain